jgi:phytoene/squalene synthetase
MTRTRKDIAAATLDPSTIESRVADAARRLYDAEIALHHAHQSHVDAWINAASAKLHGAVEAHMAALAETTGRNPVNRPAQVAEIS